MANLDTSKISDPACLQAEQSASLELPTWRFDPRRKIGVGFIYGEGYYGPNQKLFASAFDCAYARLFLLAYRVVAPAIAQVSQAKICRADLIRKAIKEYLDADAASPDLESMADYLVEKCLPGVVFESIRSLCDRYAVRIPDLYDEIHMYNEYSYSGPQAGLFVELFWRLDACVFDDLVRLISEDIDALRDAKTEEHAQLD
jgi:hypothetical protein